MRICAITPITVTLPLVRERMSYCFVRLETDTGVVAYGEACDSYGCSYAPVIAAVIDGVYAPLLDGRQIDSADALTEVLRLCTRRRIGEGWIAAHARSAIDIALWDALAKERGVSLRALLGGDREAVPVYVSGTFLEEGDAAWHAELLQPLLDRGVRAAKLRLGPQWHDDLATLADLRRLLPSDVELMVDGSETFTLPTARRIDAALARLDIAWFEEPLPQPNRDGIRRLRSTAGVPVAYGEHLFGMDDAIAAMAAGELDVLQPDAAICGGIGEARRMAAAAAPFGVRVALHQCAGPIALAANLHAAASVPAVSAVEYGVFSIPAHAALSGTDVFAPERIVDGCLALPPGPGLGVELDLAAASQHPYVPPARRVAGTVGGVPDRFVGHR
jgi:D-galactarolactone cycloisomerase